MRNGIDMTLATTNVTPADQLCESAMMQIERGELRAASGTLWDATAAALTALAQRRGWAISKHKQYEDVYQQIKPEFRSKVLYHGMGSARLMERNWVEDYELSESWVIDSAEQIREMIDALQSV